MTFTQNEEDIYDKFKNSAYYKNGMELSSPASLRPRHLQFYNSKNSKGISSSSVAAKIQSNLSASSPSFVPTTAHVAAKIQSKL
jgi:hypothetical protein